MREDKDFELVLKQGLPQLPVKSWPKFTVGLFLTSIDKNCKICSVKFSTISSVVTADSQLHFRKFAQLSSAIKRLLANVATIAIIRWISLQLHFKSC